MKVDFEAFENTFLETFENYQAGAVSNQLTDIGMWRVCWGESLIVYYSSVST